MPQTTNAKPGALEGIRVLDFSQIFSGPHCCRLMADMGAEVIKIERPPDGDIARQIPYVAGRGFSSLFVHQNSGKKAICLDLRHPEAVEIARRLVSISDVLVQNFMPGAMDRMGLGYPQLKQSNPGLIMCSISGYGQDSPLAQRPAGEQVIQAHCGVVWMTGDPDGAPFLPGWGYADSSTGLHALSAILAALLYRERTGSGQHIDLALADCVFSQNDLPYMDYILSKGSVSPTRYGRFYPHLVPLGVFEGKDGYVVLGARSDSAFGRLAECMGRPELPTDPRFDTDEHRTQNRQLLYPIIEEWVRSQPSTRDVEGILNKAEIMCSRVNTIEDILDHPNTKARNMLVDVEHPYLGKTRVVNSPFRFSDTESGLRGPPPFLGEHNEEILTGLLGLSKREVAWLHAQGSLLADEEIAKELYEAL